jgi:hypothetical protein
LGTHRGAGGRGLCARGTPSPPPGGVGGVGGVPWGMPLRTGRGGPVGFLGLGVAKLSIWGGSPKRGGLERPLCQKMSAQSIVLVYSGCCGFEPGGILALLGDPPKRLVFRPEGLLTLQGLPSRSGEGWRQGPPPAPPPPRGGGGGGRGGSRGPALGPGRGCHLNRWRTWGAQN